MMKNLDLVNALSIVDFHDGKMRKPEWPSAVRPDTVADVWYWIEENHRCNTLLWNEEDKARRSDVVADAIAACKRLIDQYNQRRNDATEAIDEELLKDLDKYPRLDNARLNSETAGSMIDRLSILCLKIHHMTEQTLRRDADEGHISRCREKRDRLIEQREDLSVCVDALLAESRRGTVYFKVYRQFKMYNDPTLNPYLSGVKNAGGRAER